LKTIFAEIVTIGDEILYGQITDTNSQWISAELDLIGIKTIRKTSVGDQTDEIVQALQEALSRADIVLITGGLGPTKDDITKKTLAAFFDSDMEVNEEALAQLEAYMEKRGRPLNDLNKTQAIQPKKAKYIKNSLGTAPGMWFDKDGKVVVSMPGVPYEMKEMVTTQLIPAIQQKFQTPVIRHMVVRTVEVPESTLAMQIEAWEDALPAHIRLAYLPSMGQVKLRLTGFGDNEVQLQEELNLETEKLIVLLGDHVYGFGQMELEKLVGQMLLHSNLTLATAESCTGGHVASMLTSVPGSSRYFEGSIVAYNEAVKMKLLHVRAETLAKYAVVSAEVAEEMASGVCKATGASVGLSTTGVAGPASDDDAAPVGTVFVGLCIKGEVWSKKLQLHTERSLNIQLASLFALNFLRKKLLEISKK
jgi:nicotinamide-nucleotide amidase